MDQQLSPGVRRFLLGFAAIAVIALGLVWAMTPKPAAGLAEMPPLTDLTQVADEALLLTVQIELSRRIGTDWRRLPDGMREIWMIEAAEGGLRSGGLLLELITKPDPALAAHRPRLADLPAAYRSLGLDEAAAVLQETLRLPSTHPNELAAWAAYDLSDSNAGPPPPNPCTALDARFRAATAGSAEKRRQWLRAHAADFTAKP